LTSSSTQSFHFDLSPCSPIYKSGFVAHTGRRHPNMSSMQANPRLCRSALIDKLTFTCLALFHCRCLLEAHKQTPGLIGHLSVRFSAVCWNKAATHFVSCLTGFAAGGNSLPGRCALHSGWKQQVIPSRTIGSPSRSKRETRTAASKLLSLDQQFAVLLNHFARPRSAGEKSAQSPARRTHRKESSA